MFVAGAAVRVGLWALARPSNSFRQVAALTRAGWFWAMNSSTRRTKRSDCSACGK